MKNLQFLLLTSFVAFIAASPVSSKPSFHIDLECTKGSVFWCQNVITAKKCNAIDFCINAVWTKHNFAKDETTSICDDCKEWVSKAREAISGKTTSDEVIKTLKWTCDLIPVKSIMQDCEKIVDDNVPAIFKMLQSEMDPDIICSTLKFCNNMEYRRALMDHSMNQKLLPFTCGQCNHIGSIIQNNFETSERDSILEGLLGICGELSSYSDACSTHVMINFNGIYDKLQSTITKDSLCHMSRSCVQNFHDHHEGIVDIVPAEGDPDIPCQLCQQLVLHLRELLIANTTELEFKNVMIGLCHQTGQFSDECINITNEYYQFVYNFLVDKLNANKMCIMIGICPSTGKNRLRLPTMPLVSTNLHPMPQDQSSRNNLIDVKMVFEESSLSLFKNGSWCTVCEYLMHFVQEALAKQSTEDEIIDIVKSSCLKLPTHVQNQCKEIVDLYGDALVSLLDQNIKARYICPRIKMCPPNMSVEFLSETAIDEKPTCPFCLMALQEVKDMIETNKTEQNIADTLSKLCIHLNAKLKSQCTEFVNKYSQQVIEMILADFTPQEACTFLKLCTDSEEELDIDSMELIDDGSIGRSDDFTIFDDVPEIDSTPQCELCKKIIKIVEERVINKKSKDEIRRELEQSCSRLKKFSTKCKEFVDKYSDKIVDLIEQELTPDQICRDLVYCVSLDDRDSQDYDSGLDILLMAVPAVDEISEQPQCVICEFVMSKLDEELKDKKTDAEIKQTVKNICNHLPASVGSSCNKFVDSYLDAIIMLIATTKPSEMCAELKMCPATLFDMTNVHRDIAECAVCRGLVESMDTIIEDPYVDTNLQNFEEKVCEKFSGKYQLKCHNLAKTYGLYIINLLKNLTESDEICYKLKLCSFVGHGPSGIVELN